MKASRAMVGFRQMVRAFGSGLILLSISLLGFNTTSFAKVDCVAKNRTAKQAMRAKIAELQKTEKLTGRQVPSGKCTLRAIKRGVTMGTTTDFEDAVEIENAINCINLDMYYLDQECQCANLNLDYVRDEDLQDQVFAEYDKMRKLEQSLIRKGIKDPAIKMLVSQAGTMKDCVNRQTLAVISGVSAKLQNLDLQQDSTH